MSRDLWKMTLELTDPEGKSLAVAINLHDFDRNLEAPPSPQFEGSFRDVTAGMRQRDLRRGLVQAVAGGLARRLADALEDKEGWHGERRAELMRDRQRLEL